MISVMVSIWLGLGAARDHGGLGETRPPRSEPMARSGSFLFGKRIAGPRQRAATAGLHISCPAKSFG